MGITVVGKTLIDYRPQKISGVQALGGYLLRLTTEITMPAWDADSGVHFSNVIAKVFVGDLILGFAHPELPITLVPFGHQHQAWMNFEIIVSAHSIEAIEKRRCGGCFEIKLEINGEARDPRNIMRGSQLITYNVNASSWVDILKDMGYGHTLLLELPFNAVLDNDLQKAISYIDRARQHLLYGHYNEVVADCRQALEFLLPSPDNLSKIRSNARANHKAMKKSERMIVFLDALNLFTQLSHHPDDSGGLVAYTREEAVLVLGATVSSLSSEDSHRRAIAILDVA